MATIDMPKKFIELEQEEMMYLDGGSTGKTAVERKDGYVTVYISATTLKKAGTGIAIAGVVVPGIVIDKAVTVAGILMSSAEHGIKFNYKPGTIRVWGVRRQ